MNVHRWYGLLIAAFAVMAHGAVANDSITPDPGREAFNQPFAGLSDAEREVFFRGRNLFRQSWVIAPARDQTVGLGPLHNRIACVSCHPKNGRGQTLEPSSQRLHGMLVRLSVPGTDEHGGPKPHPRYGNQLNEEGIPGVPGEGSAQLDWSEFDVPLGDGARVAMRRPVLTLRDLHYGPLDANTLQTSVRVGPPVFGLGLLEAIAVDDLLHVAQQSKPDGVKGKVNWVWDSVSGKALPGRFGLKANVATLRAQVADALLGDLGVTSSLHPRENCQRKQVTCLKAPNGGHPELSDLRLNDLETYFRYLAVPARRHTENESVVKGERIFAQAGCVSCHRPQWRTARDVPLPHLADIELQPFTDLLVHDMGEGLADGRPDFNASGREWRTPPLWGIGLTILIGEHASYLHDGRARTFTEAILWHGGEAQIARDRFAVLSAPDRDALESFLWSL